MAKRIRLKRSPLASMRRTPQREDLFEVFDPATLRVFGPLNFKAARDKLRELRGNAVKPAAKQYEIYDQKTKIVIGPFNHKDAKKWVEKAAIKARSGSASFRPS